MSDCDNIIRSGTQQTSKNKYYLPSQSVSPVLEQATSPIALRYWNYCLNRSESDRQPSNAPWRVNHINSEPSFQTKHVRPQTPQLPRRALELQQSRSRSESVPRTFRTFKITARVESPATVPKIDKTEVSPRASKDEPKDQSPKSSSPVSERPPTPRRKPLVINNDVANKTINDVEHSTKHVESQKVNCDNDTERKQETLQSSVLQTLHLLPQEVVDK